MSFEESNRPPAVVYIVTIIFILSGLALIAFGITLISKESKTSDDYVPVKAIISRIDKDTYHSVEFGGGGISSNTEVEYYVYIDYEYDGHEFYDVPIDSYDITMYEGKEMTIYCNKNNPSQFRTYANRFTPYIIMMVFGVVFTVGATVTLIVKLKNSAKFDDSYDEKNYSKPAYASKIEAKYASKNGSSSPTGKKRCYNCGGSMDANQTVCPYCGNKFKQ